LVRQRTAELNHLAYHDALTDLPNRILFEDRLTQALILAERNRQTLGVLFLSMDGFKKVQGHAFDNFMQQGKTALKRRDAYTNMRLQLTQIIEQLPNMQQQLEQTIDTTLEALAAQNKATGLQQQGIRFRRF
jgi:hypothetical protein